MIASGLHIAFPNADHSEAALRHVGVLRLIELHAPCLSLARLWKAHRVAVPVVAVKLNDEASAWHERINAELACKQFLSEIRHADLVKHFVASALQIIDFTACLVGVHRDQHLPARGVSISAGWGTVSRVCLSLTGRGPRERPVANLAPVMVSIAALPFVGVLGRTEKRFRFRQTLCVDVNGVATDSAHHIKASLSSWLGADRVALVRAKTLRWAKTISRGRTARFAYDCSDLVKSGHSCIISLSYLIAKPDSFAGTLFAEAAE